MAPNVRVYEPLYAAGQELTEPAFEPLKLETNLGLEWRELGILVHMYRLGLHRQQRLTGLCSPKFRTKTRTEGSRFVDFAEQNSAADVVFVNPSPQHVYLSFNCWTAGDFSHPGLVARSQALLDAVGVPWRLSEQPYYGSDITCYCNYWVASEAFWERYVGGVLLPIADHVERFDDSEAVQAILSRAPHISPAPFLAFTVERLFSTMLRENPKYRAVPMLLDPEELCLTRFELELLRYARPRVEAAIRNGFDEETKGLLQFTTEARLRFILEYFQHHDHPYSGVPTNVAIYREFGHQALEPA